MRSRTLVAVLASGLALAGLSRVEARTSGLSGASWAPTHGSPTPRAGSRRLPTPAARLRQIEQALARRFAPLIGAAGVRGSSSCVGGVQVRMAIRPTRDARGQARAWTPTESRRILQKMREVLAAGFPDVTFLPSSGIELEPLARGGQLEVATFRALAQARRGAPGPRDPRTGALLGAPGDASPSPEASPADPPEPPAPLEDAQAAQPPPAGTGVNPDDGVAVPAADAPPPAPVESPAPETTTTVDVAPGAIPTPAAPSAATPPAAAAPRSGLSSLYPAQPGGYGHAGFAIRSQSATEPSSIYHYPRDNYALEFLIEREVGIALRGTFKDAKVRATITRPQVVRLDVEVAMHGHPQENREHILHFTRDTTNQVFKEKFNLLRIHHKSKLRVTEADDRFSYDYRFHELTPYGHHDRHEEDPLFSTLRLERDRVIDVPRAFMLPRDGTSIALSTSMRTAAPGLFSNVSISTANAYQLTFRRGFWNGLEASLGYYGYENDVVPTARGVLTASSGSLSAVTFGARYRMPYEINGFAMAVGLTHAFQKGADRRFFLPDDFERLYNLYLVGSRRYFESILVHVAAKRTFLTERPDFEDNALNSLGLAFEYVVHERAVMMLELEYEQYEEDTLAAFGTILDGEGLNVNVGAVVGTRLGDVEISARKITLDAMKDVTVGVAYKW
jgi:hypothetical protein